MKGERGEPNKVKSSLKKNVKLEKKTNLILRIDIVLVGRIYVICSVDLNRKFGKSMFIL